MSKKPIKPNLVPDRPNQKKEEEKSPLDSLELAITNCANQVLQVANQFLRAESGNRITENNSYSLEVKLQQVLQNQLGAAIKIVEELRAATVKPENKEQVENEPSAS